MIPSDLIQECVDRYRVKDSKVSGLIHIVSLNEDNKVVKKTKTLKKAAQWVRAKVKEELLKEGEKVENLSK